MKFKWIQSLKPMLLSLLLLSRLGDWCDGNGGNGETPPDSTGCGVGAGDYDFKLAGSLPQSFNCNNSRKFLVTIDPDIDASYYGNNVFNRLYFDLESDSNYQSNYAQFSSWNTNDQQLEWGGSVPSDSYLVCATMKNIQLNSSCKDSIHRIVEKDLGWIYITEYSNPQKVMEIEYFCQESDTSEIERYDVFLAPNTEEYIDIAFNVANTTYDLWSVDTDLPCSLVLNTDQAIAEYINSYKQYDDEMFLCGIKGFRDAQGNLVEKGGSTIWTDTIGFTPSCYSGSLIAVKSIINQSAPLYKVDYKQVITAATIHELGHQRAILHHHDDFENPVEPFCVMNKHVIYSSFNTYSNPHFCDVCVTRIKNVSW